VSFVFLTLAIGAATMRADDFATFMVNHMGAFPGGNYSVAFGVNSQGTVVGESQPCVGCSTHHAAIWSDGRLFDAGTLGGDFAFAYAINSLGHIVGFSSTSALNPTHAFLITTGGEKRDLGTLGGSTSIAFAINQSDVVIGMAMLPDETRHAAMFANGTVTDLGTLGGLSVAQGINRSGQIVGWSETSPGGVTHAFLYENGVMRDLGTFGGDSSTATAINDAGQIVGQRCFGGWSPTQCRAYRYDSRTGTFLELPFLGGPFAYAWGINSAGDVVGQAQLSSGNYRAFLYRDGRGMWDLNQLVPMEDSWTLTAANAINDAGVIVGFGAGPAGNRGFILNPTLSEAWANRDIGPTGVTGSAIRSVDGPFTVRGSGRDIWDTADSFHLVHNSFAFNLDGQITARVDGITNTSQYAKAGLMIRESLTTDSAHVILDVKPDGGVEFMQRDSTSAETHFIAGGFVQLPYWLRLSRDGSTITGSISPDGRTWTAVGSTMMTIHPESQEIGLAVTSRNQTALNTAIFSGASIVPAPWTAQDIGSTNRVGSTLYRPEVATIEAAGRDIWDAVDSFHFLHQPFSGDGEVVAQILRVPNTHFYAKAGVMIRNGLSSGAAHVILDVKPDGNVEFMQRQVAFGVTTFLAGGRAAPPSFVKLRRTGNTVIASVSPNGISWSEIGRTTVDFPANVNMGVAVTSHDNDRLGVAEVRNPVVRP